MPVAAVCSLLPPSFPSPMCSKSMARRCSAPLVAMLAYNLFTLAALHAMLMAVAERRLHGAHLTRAFAALPPLLTMETLLFRLIGIAFVLLPHPHRGLRRAVLRAPFSHQPSGSITKPSSRSSRGYDLRQPAGRLRHFQGMARQKAQYGRSPASSRCFHIVGNRFVAECCWAARLDRQPEYSARFHNRTRSAWTPFLSAQSAILVALLALSGFFSMAETAMMASQPYRRAPPPTRAPAAPAWPSIYRSDRQAAGHHPALPTTS